MIGSLQSEGGLACEMHRREIIFQGLGRIFREDQKSDLDDSDSMGGNRRCLGSLD